MSHWSNYLWSKIWFCFKVSLFPLASLNYSLFTITYKQFIKLLFTIVLWLSIFLPLSKIQWNLAFFHGKRPYLIDKCRKNNAYWYKNISQICILESFLNKWILTSFSFKGCRENEAILYSKINNVFDKWGKKLLSYSLV